MSAEATGWVYRYSPARGAAYSVHLALADSANDQHGYELWMRQAWLATKARVSRKAAGEALQWLVAQGLLQLVESGAKAGSANRYRFLMPDDLPVVFDTRGTTAGGTPLPPQVAPGTTTRGTGVPPQVAHNPRGNSTPSPTNNNVLPLTDYDAFDAFWTAYPRHTAKGEARKAWPAAVRAAGGTDPIIDGAKRFAADPNREDAYTPHPATWLRAERWGDDPLPPRAKQANGRAPARQLMTDRSVATGRIDL